MNRYNNIPSGDQEKQKITLNFASESDGDESSIGASVISDSYYRERRLSADFNGPKYSGYMFKKTGHDEWKRRYFETSGFFLTYFKSKKKNKMLGALNLKKVVNIYPSIAQNLSSESKGCIFHVEVNNTVYTLRASSPMDCKRWINVLSDLQLGRDRPVDTISEEGSDDVSILVNPQLQRNTEANSVTMNSSSEITKSNTNPTPTNRPKRGSLDGIFCCF